MAATRPMRSKECSNSSSNQFGARRGSSRTITAPVEESARWIRSTRQPISEMRSVYLPVSITRSRSEPVRDPQQIELAMSESVARYVLVLLDVDDYENCPDDYETAKLRRSIQEQLTR